MFNRYAWLALAALTVVLTVGGCGDKDKKDAKSDKPTVKVAYVTNGDASFWDVAEHGAMAAGKDFNADVSVLKPTEGVAHQKRFIEELLANKIDGIAISPIDPDNQTDILDQAAAGTNLITHDSDAPASKRLAYVGMDNYVAGRMCGQLVREAMPQGGSVMIFVGRLEQLNAKLRRQGVIDELLDRSFDRTRYDVPGKVLGEGGKYVILDTLTDNFDFGAAKSLAEDAIAKHSDLGCMVGLFAYNPPKCLEAVKEAGKLKQIKIVAFDEEDGTLQGIKDGEIHGTIVQNPYLYGYESVRILAALARGDKSALPEKGFMNIPARTIRKDNVDRYWSVLKRLVAGEPIKIAFVTNNASDFWKIAEAGVKKANADFRLNAIVRQPEPGTAAEQQRIIEDLIANGYSGIAISPNDAVNQTPLINEIAKKLYVITHDSDAPNSDRLCYVGTRNYKAGREAGKLIKEVLPNGGKIMLFVGRNDAQNAIERRQGIIDEIKGANIEIIDTLTDGTDRARAKANVEDTIAKHPKIGCLVGLWSYNGPAILEAVNSAGLEGKIPIVCFDEEDATLQGVIDGHIHATVVQQPYEFGYQAVRILGALCYGRDPKIPEGGIVEVPVKVIRQQDAAAFWENLKKLKGKKK